MIHATMNTLFTAMQLTLEIENMPEYENTNFYLGNYRRLCLCPSKADRHAKYDFINLAYGFPWLDSDPPRPLPYEWLRSEDVV